MTPDCHRRTLIAALGTGLAGCLSGGPPAGSDQSPTATLTATPPADLPAACPKSPDVDGLPGRPEDADSEATTDFVAAYERRYAVATNPAYADLNYMEHVSTRHADGGYRVHFFVEPLAAGTPEEGSTTTPEGDPTPTPGTVGTYNVGYFVDEWRVVREKQPSAITYTFSPDDSFDPRDDGTLIEC